MMSGFSLSKQIQILLDGNDFRDGVSMIVIQDVIQLFIDELPEVKLSMQKDKRLTNSDRVIGYNKAIMEIRDKYKN